MGWYKIAQQGLLFYPHGVEPAGNREKVPPSYIDPSTKEKFYQCNICKQTVPEDTIAEWFTNIEEDKGSSYQLPQYNEERILQGLIEISQYLLPFYNQLQDYIKKENLESKKNETYDYGYNTALTRWEVQVPQLQTIIQKYPELIDICNYQSSQYNWNKNLCWLIRNSNSEINGEILEKLSDFILNPQSMLSELASSSKEKFNIPYLLPVCEDCFEDLTKCESCQKPIFPGDRRYKTTWSDTDFICEECIEQGNLDICMECGLADTPEDMHYLEDEGSVCSDCYKNMSSGRIEWAEDTISDLDIPVGKNYPVSKKSLDTLNNFLSRYIKKYGDKELNLQEWGRLTHLSKKSGLPEGALEYLDFIGESYDSKKDSYSHDNISDILKDIENNIEAQDYMKEQYPNLSSYKDLPFDIDVVDNYSHKKQGFTITITPSKSFFDYAEKKYPGIRNVWDKMSRTPHHSDVLAYARCAYEGGDALVINNLQRDADFENYLSSAGGYSGERAETAKWLDTQTKQWNVFLLNLVRAMAISKDISAYLTTFDQQKEKWGNLPIHKSTKTYKEVPEQMGFELSDADNASGLVEDGSYYNEEMYQLAKDMGNWFKKACV
jgi:hypothetical protein